MYHMQLVFIICSLFSYLMVSSDGVVEALMWLISSFRNLGTVLNPDCYFRHSKKVIPNFDLMTTLI